MYCYFPCIFALQFLSTHFCTALGEGHNPVNCPTKPRFANEIAAFLGSVGGNEISSMSTSFFTNLLIDGLAFGASFSAIRVVNVAS